MEMRSEMLIVIDVMGNDEETSSTIVEDLEKKELEKKRAEWMKREILKHMPQPELVPVESTQTTK